MLTISFTKISGYGYVLSKDYDDLKDYLTSTSSTIIAKPDDIKYHKRKLTKEEIKTLRTYHFIFQMILFILHPNEQLAINITMLIKNRHVPVLNELSNEFLSIPSSKLNDRFI